MRLLARREHAAAELTAKLEARGFGREAIADEIARLAQAGLQSDDRFADLFVEQRAARGDGPLKLHAALGERGVDAACIDAALAPLSAEWPDRARTALERRFGALAATSRTEQARRMRFLQGRGFPAEVVRSVVERRDLDD